MADPNQLDNRPIQTRVKHEILAEYLDRWGGIILNGMRQAYQQNPVKSNWVTRLVYVDCFSFEGRYAENGAEVYGSPIIGIRALDNHRESAIRRVGFNPQTIVILFEEDRSTYNKLRETLDQLGYGSRVRETSNFSQLQSGDIAVIYGDYREYAQSLIAFTSNKYTWSFYLLDPYGSKGIPLETVAPIICQEHTDVMINFPIYDVHKKTGSAKRGTSTHSSHIEYIDEMYGSNEWRLLAERLNGEALEQANADLYGQTLEAQDYNLGVKMIPLSFQDMERKIYYLVLTTHDGTGGLAMNEILDSARIREYDHRMEHRRTKGGQQFSMFGDEVEDSNRPSTPQVDVGIVVQEITELCRGEMVTYREVLRRMVNSPYYHDDVKEAMSQMRKQGSATFDPPLRNNTSITFRR